LGKRTGRETLTEGLNMNWSEFFNMGGYAFFVWTSYALALAVVVVNIVSPILQRKKVIAHIKRTMRRESIDINRRQA
jgi:heme exporter protein D